MKSKDGMSASKFYKSVTGKTTTPTLPEMQRAFAQWGIKLRPKPHTKPFTQEHVSQAKNAIAKEETQAPATNGNGNGHAEAEQTAKPPKIDWSKPVNPGISVSELLKQADRYEKIAAAARLLATELSASS